MRTRYVELTEELDRFVSHSVESGRYEDASEVVRAALRSLERETEEQEAKLAGLRVAIDEGDAEPGVFERVRERLGFAGYSNSSGDGSLFAPSGRGY